MRLLSPSGVDNEYLPLMAVSGLSHDCVLIAERLLSSNVKFALWRIVLWSLTNFCREGYGAEVCDTIQGQALILPPPKIPADALIYQGGGCTIHLTSLKQFTVKCKALYIEDVKGFALYIHTHTSAAPANAYLSSLQHY